MKKYRFIFLFLLLSLSNSLVAANNKTTLTLFNWAGNNIPELITGFEKEFSLAWL